MKARVIRPFRDKHTNEIRRKGQEIEVTKKRLEEINSAAFGPFVEAVVEPEEPTKPATKKSTTKKNKK